MADDLPVTPCKLSPPEYDTSQHCGEHGGVAWLYGPHSNRCDRAPQRGGDPAKCSTS